MPLSAILTPQSYKNIIETIEHTKQRIQNGELKKDFSTTLEVEFIHKSGAKVDAEVTTNFIYDKDDVITGIQGISRDITDRKRAEKAMLKMHDFSKK